MRWGGWDSNPGPADYESARVDAGSGGVMPGEVVSAGGACQIMPLPPSQISPVVSVRNPPDLPSGRRMC